MWRQIPEYNLVLSHVPLHNSSLNHWGEYGESALNVHGHIHQKPSPSEDHFCVSVEQTNYMPVDLESLKREG